MQKYYTMHEAAEHLGITPRTLRGYCQAGRLGNKVGWYWIITGSDLKRFSGLPRNAGRPKSLD